MSHALGMMIETLVAALLAITIAYCIMLNRRLKRLRADEASLKVTIAELITASEIAERAIGSLKVTVADCDRDLGDRLRAAEHFSKEIGRQLTAGEDILNRLGRVAATRKYLTDQPLPPPDVNSTLAAAKAFANKTRPRFNGEAA